MPIIAYYEVTAIDLTVREEDTEALSMTSDNGDISAPPDGIIKDGETWRPKFRES